MKKKKLEGFKIKNLRRVLVILIFVVSLRTLRSKHASANENEGLIQNIVQERLVSNQLSNQLSNQHNRHVLLVKSESTPNNFSGKPLANGSNPSQAQGSNPSQAQGSNPSKAPSGKPSGSTQTNFIHPRQVPGTVPSKVQLEAKRRKNFKKNSYSDASGPSGGSKPSGGGGGSENEPNNFEKFYGPQKTSFTDYPDWLKIQKPKKEKHEACELDENFQMDENFETFENGQKFENNVIFSIEKNSGVGREARSTVNNLEAARDIRHMMDRLNAGGPGSFSGVKYIKGKIFQKNKLREVTGTKGGRVYFVTLNEKVHVIAFSDKSNQDKVLELLAEKFKNNR
jgi:hypothetical protein